MARHDTAARRYAEAAFQVGRSESTLDRWEADLTRLGEAVRVPELRTVLQHPAIPFGDKERVLRRAVDDVAPGPMNLVLLMIRRGRPRALEPMLTHFHELVRRERGVVRAVVRTALALDERERAELNARLGALTGRQVDLEELVDPTLIGGLAVRIGDQLYDASVRGRLERLRAKLTAA